MADPLAQMLQLVAVEEESAQRSLQEFGGAMEQQVDISAQIGESKAEQVNLNTQLLTSAAQKKLQNEQANLAAAEALGTRPGAGSEVLTGLLASIQAKTEVVNELEDKVVEIGSKSTILTPIGFLKNLFVGPVVRQEYRAQKWELDRDIEKASHLAALTLQTAAANNAIAQTTNAADIELLAKQGQEAANMQRLLASKEALGYGTQLIVAMRQTDAATFNRALQMYNLTQDDMRWKQSAELRQLQLDEAHLRIAENKETAEGLAQGIAFINLHRLSTNQPEITPLQYKRLINSPGEEGDRLRRQERLGMMQYQTKGVALLGESPGDAWETLMLDNPILPKAVQDGGVEVLRQANQDVDQMIDRLANPLAAMPEGTNTYGLTKSNIKDTIAVRQARTNAAHFRMQQLGNDLTKHNAANPLQAPPIQSVVKEYPVLMQSNFGSSVLKPMMDAGIGDTDPTKMLEWTFEAMEKNKLSFNEARDALYVYFQGSIALNNATKGYTRVGLPSQQHYPVKVNSPRYGAAAAPVPFNQIPLFRDTQSFDFANRTDITQALIYHYSGNRSKQIQAAFEAQE